MKKARRWKLESDRYKQTGIDNQPGEREQKGADLNMIKVHNNEMRRPMNMNSSSESLNITTFYGIINLNQCLT